MDAVVSGTEMEHSTFVGEGVWLGVPLGVVVGDVLRVRGLALRVAEGEDETDTLTVTVGVGGVHSPAYAGELQSSVAHITGFAPKFEPS